MFESIKQYQNIIVTGPQGSGTRIGANIIAWDQSRKYVDEQDIGIQSISKLTDFIYSTEKTCIQAPRLSCCCHLLDFRSTAVVFMIRDTSEIEASQKRIDWKHEEQELNCYFRKEGPIAPIKYEVWNQFQKPIMKLPFLEVEYASLSNHRLWANKRDRTNFQWNQTKTKATKLLQ